MNYSYATTVSRGRVALFGALLTTAFLVAPAAQAAGITDVSVNDVAIQTAATPGDIRQGAGQETELTFEFTLDADTNITTGETITLTFDSGSDAGEFFDFSNITAADVTVLVNGAAAAGVTPVITTVPAVGVNGVITLTATGNLAAAGDEVSVLVGNDTNRVINPTVPSEDAFANEVGSPAEAYWYKVSIAGDFGTEAGIAGSVKSAVIWPVLDDDQVHVYAYIAPQLIFNLDLGDASYNNGNNTSLAGACTTGTADDDDQNCDFFTDFGNSIDFGMPISTQTTYATPAHPTTVMDGGDVAQNYTDGGAHGFHVGTNAVNGLVTTVWGETLTHSNLTDTIAAIGGAAAPAVGVDQFGFCLAADTNGTAGTDATVTASNPGEVNATIDAAAGDCTAATYAFNATAAGAAAPTLNTLVSSTGPTAVSFFDMEYMVNVDAATPAGVYSTDLTFITTGLF